MSRVESRHQQGSVIFESFVVRGDTLLMSARLKLITKPSSDLLIHGRAYQCVPRVFKFDALIMFELLKFDFFVLLSSAVGEKNVRGSNSSPADAVLAKR